MKLKEIDLYITEKCNLELTDEQIEKLQIIT